MPDSSEMRRLEAKWRTRTGWPLWLEWIEISGLRGWNGQKFEITFPIMALVGENGVGKSTVLQCAAAVYRQPEGRKKKTRFASDFFPSTAWDTIGNATIRYSARQGSKLISAAVRKRSERWRGNPERPERSVEYIDLSRIQPVPARLGYLKLAKANVKEASADAFDKNRLGRFSSIMARTYDLAKMALTNADTKRSVPVLGVDGAEYSGFHQGAGETTIAELLQADLPRYGIILIDEIETSLHPRAQRRLIRDLASICRERELQVILTTHSPYILDELPLEARACILGSGEEREIVYGVSPEFAMTRMDDVAHPEVDVYVEDERAKVLITEIMAAHARELVQRCRITPFGASSVGKALGMMVSQRRFANPTVVFLDGDEGAAEGTFSLPGDDAPERVVFEALHKANWLDVAGRTGRPFADVYDACTRAMTETEHHLWVRNAASAPGLVLGGDVLWQALCAEWASKILTPEDARSVIDAIQDALEGVPPAVPAAPPGPAIRLRPAAPDRAPAVIRPRNPPAAVDTLDLF